MKFIAEEITLCQKIAEKHRKELRKGDWFALPGDNFVKDAKELFARQGIQFIEIRGKGYTVDVYSQPHPTSPEKQLKWAYRPFPLWQISDCLEFLYKRCYILRLPYQRGLMKKDIEFSEYVDGDVIKKEAFIRGYYFMEKPLEALLKAVLAILEGS